MKQAEIKEQQVWYAMSATYRRELKAKTLLEAQAIACFVPMRYAVCSVGRQHDSRLKLVPAVHNLIFVRATPSALKRAKQTIPYLQYIMQTCSGKRMPVIVPDAQMKRFIDVCQTYDEHLHYFKGDDLNLSQGAYVRIHGGPFDGQEGVFVKVAGYRNKRVVVLIKGIVAVAITPSASCVIEELEKEYKL